MPRPAIAIALPAAEAGPVAHELREAGFDAITVSRPDQLEAVLFERRDVAVAIRAGAYTASQVSGTLSGLCRGEYDTAVERDDVTLFKSVGTALEDLAAAMLVWRLANSGAA